MDAKCICRYCEGLNITKVKLEVMLLKGVIERGIKLVSPILKWDMVYVCILYIHIIAKVPVHHARVVSCCKFVVYSFQLLSY